MPETRKKELFGKLSDAIVNMEEEEAIQLSETVVAEQIDAYEAIEKGLAHGMERAGALYEEEEYFIPELLVCSDAMYAGLEVLRPHLKTDGQAEKLKIVIGVIEGDTHDIGKNLVKIMLETAGFELVDLGRDVPPARFVEKAREIGASIIALSTLMTTTMEGMAEVIRLLDKEGIRENVKVMIGGGPISQGFADRIGADGYSVNAADAVRLARRLVSKVQAGLPA